MRRQHTHTPLLAGRAAAPVPHATLLSIVSRGIWNVGKAAQQPPALVHLTYTPEGTPSGSVAWVGKGIIYDTGGLALKARRRRPWCCVRVLCV